MSRSLQELLEFKQNLITNATRSELKLQKHLIEAGYKFEFQSIANFYIVDFLINGKYVIELDGKPHKDRVDYDRRRDQYLQEELGYRVYRIKSYRIFRDLSNVMNEIQDFISGKEVKKVRKPRKKKTIR